jgi:cytochrome c oxidase subunit 2
MTDTVERAAPPPTRRNPTWIVLAVIAAAAVLALAVVTIVAVARDDGRPSMMGSDQMMGGSMMGGPMMGHGSTSPTVPGAREIAVSATSFTFTPDEIHLRTGEDVTIVLAAADVEHDFTIDDLDVHVVAGPGSLGRGGIHAPAAPGRYTAYCSVSGHRAAGMEATVVVDAG